MKFFFLTFSSDKCFTILRYYPLQNCLLNSYFYIQRMKEAMGNYTHLHLQILWNKVVNIVQFLLSPASGHHDFLLWCLPQVILSEPVTQQSKIKIFFHLIINQSKIKSSCRINSILCPKVRNKCLQVSNQTFIQLIKCVNMAKISRTSCLKFHNFNLGNLLINYKMESSPSWSDSRIYCHRS